MEGVQKQVDQVLGLEGVYQDGNVLLEMGDEEVYYAYLLYLGAE